VSAALCLPPKRNFSIRPFDEHRGVQEDVDERPFVSRVINKLAYYEGGIVPNVEQESPADDAPPIDSPEVVAGGAIVKKKKKKKKAAPKKASENFSIQRADSVQTTHSVCYSFTFVISVVRCLGARRIFSRGWQIRGLGTKVPQREPRDGAPVGPGGEFSRSRRQVVK